jgi:hypothetical protein
MKNKNLPLYETLFILLGEIIVSLITVGVYLLIDKFSYKVITGVCLGSVVTVINFLIFAVATTRAFDKAVAARGTKEMDEEEAEKFAEAQKQQMNAAMKLSFIFRNLFMLATLVVAFILDYFDVIATLIPLLMLRPIIMVETLIRDKFKKEDK